MVGVRQEASASPAVFRLRYPTFTDARPYASQNYTADFIQSFTWAVCAGFVTPITFYYPVFFLAVLLHRTGRDFERCHRKYGKDWEGESDPAVRNAGVVSSNRFHICRVHASGTVQVHSGYLVEAASIQA